MRKVSPLLPRNPPSGPSQPTRVCRPDIIDEALPVAKKLEQSPGFPVRGSRTRTKAMPAYLFSSTSQLVNVIVPSNEGVMLLPFLSEIACYPSGAFAGSHCLPVGYYILWDFGSVLWDACGL